MTSLVAGRKTWLAGVCGPHIPVVDSIFQTKTSKRQKEATVAAKFIDGECLSFELHRVDYSAGRVRHLLKREEDLLDGRCLLRTSSAEDSGEETDEYTNESIETFEAFKAFDLAPRRCIQVQLKDIVAISTDRDSTTLTLSQAPQCCAKRSGKPRAVGMEAVQDFTHRARTVSFKCSKFAEVRQHLAMLLPHLARAPPSVATVMNIATPNRKRERATNHLADAAGSAAKQPRVEGKHERVKDPKLKR